MDTVTVRLLEREAQLASLTGYAGEARHGDGRLVLVAGEAGVGKSALVEQVQRDLPAASWFWGACDGLFTPRPLGPLFDIASKLGGELLELCRADAPREDLFRALLRQISEPAELHVLVMEDVHWADEATVDLLRFLGRRLRDAPVLLIATYRDDGLSRRDPLRVALGDLATQRSTRRIGLAPLSERAVGVLAADSGLEAAALYRLTGGNPFYVTEVVQSGMGEVPPSARDAVLARAAGLTGAARAVLDAAALTGAWAELDLLEQVTGCPPSAIDELIISGLVTAEGAALKFRHEIARLAVAEAVTAHRRGPTHGRILAALQAAGCTTTPGWPSTPRRPATGPPCCGTRPPPPAAPPNWARIAKPPLSTSGLSGSRPARIRSWWPRCTTVSATKRACWTGGKMRLTPGSTRSRSGGRSATSSGRATRCAGWPAACATCAGASEGAEAGQAAIALLEPLGPTAELASAYSSLAAQQMVINANEAAIELARRAQAIARPLGLTRVLADALNTEACASHTAGGEWAGTIHAALDIALTGRHEEQASRAYTNAYSLFTAERRFADGEHYFTDGVAYCDEHDITTYGIFLRSERTSALERTGRWDEAAALSAELLERGGPSPIIRLCPLNRLGTIRARRGEPGAWTCLDEAIQYADAAGEPQGIVPVRLNRAEACWLEGNTAQAVLEAELADDAAADSDSWERGAVAVWLRRTGSARPPRGRLADPLSARDRRRPRGGGPAVDRAGLPVRGGHGAARRGR